ncbi:uncharacterized protein I303_103007 [Kwoniella dejecticola CBS 10117]|uniref:Vacuolar import and degradation protein n=1 Tax=Kwoniella dejecticola CBS 10117 TaxID=1296121 RepID=A0A1A6AAC2_9TREE|nr:uncharacterized protein I303_03026 [Kwoniella dejecticola CBS 10117]OBR87004.1 hypothetical protein I303_03026 [Kwoniella dejecticola CBS 10117]
MPAESTPSNPLPTPNHPQGVIKCSICGMGNLNGSSSSSGTGTNEGIVVLSDPIERICGRCVNTPDARRRISMSACENAYTDEQENGQAERERVSSEDLTRNVSSNSNMSMGLGLGLRGIDLEDKTESVISNDEEHATSRETIPSPDPSTPQRDRHLESSPPEPSGLSRSLPTHHPRPWRTALPRSPLHAISNDFPATPERISTPRDAGLSEIEEYDRPPNPLLDVTKARVPSIGRGALYPGSIFRGTQTSGRSAYEVEIQFVDVNFAESNVSGYLSISHLTDSHPHLTTFFDGEIIGMKYGFITGSRYQASEHDDLRHFGRFEQFRRPSTRMDMVKPELYLRDPLPDRSKGEIKAKERDFVFLRIKEKFLVPDHRVRDISGASFAGFYYALVDLSPPLTPAEPPTPTTPSTPRTSFGPPAPIIIRRGSSQADVNRRPDGGRRRESSNKIREPPARGEATIRGYYFHSLNQEPFQELFLTHVPQRSSSTFELR